jgi:hypothetical protein
VGHSKSATADFDTDADADAAADTDADADARTSVRTGGVAHLLGFPDGQFFVQSPHGERQW